MQKGRDYIQAAIQLNPDAHFGHEKYQLRAMQWVLHPPKFTNDEYSLPSFLHDDDYKKPEKAEAGLRGLVVLGNAWESVDVFHALAQIVASNDERTAVAELAEHRARQLVDEGKKSLVPFPANAKLLKSLLLTNGGMMSDARKQEVVKQFGELRVEAERWHNHRTDFMLTKLKAGQHPDTHKDFWNDYKELPLPPLYKGVEPQLPITRNYTWIIGISVLLSLVGLKIIRRRVTRRQRAM